MTNSSVSWGACEADPVKGHMNHTATILDSTLKI